MPGTTVSPAGRAASAAAQPAVVSWSVSATTSRPGGLRGGQQVGGASRCRRRPRSGCAGRSASPLSLPYRRGRAPVGQSRWQVRVRVRQAGDRLGVAPGRRWPAAPRSSGGSTLPSSSPPAAAPPQSLPNSSALTSLVEPSRVGQVGELRAAPAADRPTRSGRCRSRAPGRSSGLLPGEVGDPAQRQQGDGADDDAGGEQHAPAC